MIKKPNEFSTAELPARRLLENLGWVYVPADQLEQERETEREVLLKSRLIGALLRLNEWMTAEQAKQVINNLEHIQATGMACNQAIHEYLTYGMPLVVDGQSSRNRNVRFFDFEHPKGGRNKFVVTTQFRVRRGVEGRSADERVIRADLVLFVNGIPLVVMEAKPPTLGWRSEAVRQLGRYQEAGSGWLGSGAPQLFRYNLLSVVHCGAEAAFAPLGATEDQYVEWKSVLPYSEDEVASRFGVQPKGQAQLIVGLLNPATLLDILRDFVIYQPEKGRVVKKLPRYQQYRTVKSAVGRILDGRRPEDRGGVVWHTQGSGKSLTMLWLATKLRRDPRLGDPKILVVTDRTQLDRQITETFRRCGFPAPRQASSTRELRQLVTSMASHTVMTTVQKFEDALNTPEGEVEVLNPSENVIVMVDEAHRTQYGLLGARMSKALPNAVLVGFTGTPIDKGFRRSTMRRFGSLIDSYTIPQSVRDGVTVRIHYEARLPELSVEGPQTLDRLYETLFGDQPKEIQAQLRRRYANKETVAGAERRIEMIALDIAEHFKKKILPNGFKAQVVAPNRAAALRYAENLCRFGLSAYPIITTTHNDGPEFKQARDLDQKQIVNAFVDPQGDPQILVVVDMLLTGFDAPVEQVLYLDRPLREHGLLQAIARVNRRFSHEWNGVVTEKTHGLVVDYCGVSRDLEHALSGFEMRDIQDVMHPLEEDPAPVIEAAAVRAESPFAGRDLNDLWACVAVFAGDDSTEGDFREDLFARFNTDYREFSRLMDRFLPDPRALAYGDRLTRLTEILAYVRAQIMGDRAQVNWADIGAKVKRLIDQRIDAVVRPVMEPVSILDSNFDEKIAALPHEEARASVMEHVIRAQIKQRLADNPVYFQKLSEQLARIIADLRQRLIDSAEASRRLAELSNQIRNEAEIAAAEGLSPVSFAIYGLLIDKEQSQFDEVAKNVALKVEEVINKHQVVIDWQSNLEVRREMRRDIKRVLRATGGYGQKELDDLTRRIVGVAGRGQGG
ncbi:MAG: type I restriction endonuclease subunit R [Acidimicrobiia bacterium]|nr:type I restriction endonuclease subunit R [Acidimicrobiia bacterium]MYB78432.1 type I restriction endonuclease subunit R [Acidimicrobiia bacterium]